MFISKPKTYYDAMKPLVYFNCYVGMGPIPYPNQSCATYIFMKFYTVFITLINWTAIYITLSSMALVTVVRKSSRIGAVVYEALVYSNSCITVIAPLLIWLRRKGMVDCVRQMVILDNTFEAVLGVNNEYGKQYIRLICQVIGVLLVMITMALCDTLMHLNVLQMDIESQFMFFCILQTLHQPVQVMLLLDVNFCTFVGYLGKKFQDVNDSLLKLSGKLATSCTDDRLFVISQNLIKTIPGKKVKNTTAEGLIIDKHYLLRKIRKAHLELCNLSRKINLSFGVQNLLSAGISFVMITGLLYAIYIDLSLDKSTGSIITMVTPAAIWSAIYVLKIWIVNHSCSRVSNEAERTGEVLYELLNSRTDKELQKEIEEFALQMLHNPVHFTACGFFTLDYTFVQGVIGSITTYLVILVQMTQVSKSPTSDSAPGRNATDISPN